MSIPLLETVLVKATKSSTWLLFDHLLESANLSGF